MLSFALSACHDKDKEQIHALEYRVETLGEQMREKDRRIAELEGALHRMRARTETVAIARSPESGDAAPEERSAFSLRVDSVAHKGRSLHAQFSITNLAKARAKASVCLRLFDRDGAEIEHFFTVDRGLARDATAAVDLDAPCSKEVWSEVARIQAYAAPLGCSDDAPPDALWIDKKP